MSLRSLLILMELTNALLMKLILTSCLGVICLSTTITLPYHFECCLLGNYLLNRSSCILFPPAVSWLMSSWRERMWVSYYWRLWPMTASIQSPSLQRFLLSLISAVFPHMSLYFSLYCYIKCCSIRYIGTVAIGWLVPGIRYCVWFLCCSPHHWQH